MVQGGDVSRAKAVTILVNLAYEKLQQKIEQEILHNKETSWN